MPDASTVLLPATAESVSEATRLLRRGELVGLPTETVYGIAASARRREAVQRLRDLKVDGRPQAFTLHVAELSQARAVLDAAPPAAVRLARRGMPGPLTLLIELDDEAADGVAESLGLSESDRGAVIQAHTLGLRCPDEPLAEQVLREVDEPVVASSAHRAGTRPARHAEDAAARVGDAVAAVIDGGRTRYGKPSTVVRVPRAGGAGGPAGKGALRIEREGVYDKRMVRDMARHTVLFVCSGNTCRSAMAEALADAQLAGTEGEVEVVSAGVMAMPGAPASAGAVRAMQQRGLALDSHRAQPLTRELVNRADVIYTMTAAHREAVLDLAPHAADKTHQLDPDHDVTDPIGADDAVYQATADMIHAAISRRFTEDGIGS